MHSNKPSNLDRQRSIRLVLGAALWAAAAGAIWFSLYTVRARTARAVERLLISPAGECTVATGDMVLAATDRGLVHVGEVAEVNSPGGRVALRIEPDVFSRLSRATNVTCWRTPFSAEQAIEALLPPAVQWEAAERIVADWREHNDALSAAWSPVVAELLSAYFQVIGGDVEAAIRRREDKLWSIAKTHGRSISAHWPAIQRRLQPILQRHLTPVLSRLISDAIMDAPKVSIAWAIALGRHAEAYQVMLDWLAEYLANMSERDRAEMNGAINRAWQAAKDDRELAQHLGVVAEAIVEDDELRLLLADVYREAIADNPRTRQFLRTQVLESPDLRKGVYEFIELFAPTARNVAALCLFDENGATRPEVVYLVRSVALGRSVSWVTLHTPPSGALPLSPGDVLVAHQGGASR